MGGCSSEFQWKNLGFNGASDKEFAVPQAKWRWQPFSWVLYRFALAVYFTGFWFIILSYWGEEPYYPEADTKAKWPIYLSNWTYFVLCLYFCMSALSTLTYHVRTRCQVSSADIDDSNVKPEIEIPTIDGSIDIKTPRADGRDPLVDSDDKNLSWYFKITWFLQNICFTGTLVVVVTAAILYFVFNLDLIKISIFTIQNHGINIAFVFIDQILIASPYRLMHAIYLFIWTWIYAIFTLIYYGAGGTNQRPYIPEHGNTYLYRDILDWEKAPVISVIMLTVTMFAIVPACHTLFWGIYKLRVRSKRRGRCECC